MRRSLAVVKVGGSLYDWPELGPQLRAWLWQQDAPWSDVLIVPGGGPTANVIRDFDRLHQLGEERAHWLALDALRLNAAFLATLLPGTNVIGHWEEVPAQDRDWGKRPLRTAILDAASFAVWDGRAHLDAGLPPCWAVTSDAIAARAAVVYEADHLVLLKSVTVPQGMSWEEAGERGYVDTMFAQVLRQASANLCVRAVNLRTA
jgi:aspartokinase-like uncharacterized kinase